MSRLMLIYIKENIWMSLFYLLWCGVFSLLLFLTHGDLQTILYGIVLTTSAFLLYVCIDGYYFISNSLRWEKIIQIGVFSKELLPKAQSHMQNYYQEVLYKLIEKEQELITKWDQKSTDIEDYYTLWTHQIKTPIAALHLLQQTMADKNNMDIENYELIKKAQQELFKIERYVELMIQFNQFENASLDFNFQEISLDDLIRQILKKYAVLFVHSNITLNYVPLSKQVLSDNKWLSFVVEQLISNALKYTQAGQIAILWETNNQCLSITDTGVGICQEDIPRVFEKGFTGFNGQLDKKSTGFGLYMSKKIVEKLGHSVKIQSKVGEGTTVSIIFLQ